MSLTSRLSLHRGILICLIVLSLTAGILNRAASGDEKGPPDAAPSTETLAAYNTGRALYLQGKVDEAIKAYQKALELDPRFDFACGSLGYAFYEQGKYQESASMYEKAISLNAGEPFYHGEIALAYEKTGKRAEARGELEKAITLAPENWIFHYNLAVLKERDRDGDGALASFRKAASLCKDRKEKKAMTDKIEMMERGTPKK